MKRGNKIRYAMPTNEKETAENRETQEINFDNLLYNRKEDYRLNCIIPPVIKNVHPRMRDETYKLLKFDFSFLKTTTTVCDNCMVDIGVSKEGYLTTKYTKSGSAYIGQGSLRPENLADRRRVKWQLVVTDSNEF